MITYHASWSFPEQIAMVTKARKINLQELLRNWFFLNKGVPQKSVH